jgi:anti-sigma factor RsiW
VADTKPNPDDGGADATEELVAYLDGELDPKEAESIATRLGLDPKLRAEADALQRAWDILDVLPRSQPSAAFANRTVSQVIPIPAAASGTQPLTPPIMPALPAQRPGVGFWLSAAAVVLLAGAAGYFGRQAIVPAPKPVSPEPTADDFSLLKNLRLYRNVDDVEYLKKLDAPELFGDEGE